MSKQSRYHDARPFLAEPGMSKGFSGIRPRFIGPATGVVEHTVKEWERIDLIARNYYNDSNLWWRILDANSEFMCAIELFKRSHLDDQTVDAVNIILVPRARE